MELHLFLFLALIPFILILSIAFAIQEWDLKAFPIGIFGFYTILFGQMWLVAHPVEAITILAIIGVIYFYFKIQKAKALAFRLDIEEEIKRKRN